MKCNSTLYKARWVRCVFPNRSYVCMCDHGLRPTRQQRLSGFDPGSPAEPKRCCHTHSHLSVSLNMIIFPSTNVQLYLISLFTIIKWLCLTWQERMCNLYFLSKSSSLSSSSSCRLFWYGLMLSRHIYTFNLGELYTFEFHYSTVHYSETLWCL